MDNTVTAVRAVKLSKFKAASWQLVAFDVDRYAEDMDMGQLSDILKLVLVAPAPAPVVVEEPPPPPRPVRRIPRVSLCIYECLCYCGMLSTTSYHPLLSLIS